MGKIVSICQPNFLPWLGYFEMGHRADIYVMLDDVQYIKGEWVNRNKILNPTNQGWQWITVPLKKRKLESLINEMEIQNQLRWGKKMFKTFQQIYSKAPYYDEHIQAIRDVLSTEWYMLVDLNVSIIRMLYRILGIENNLILSSDLAVKSRRTQKLADICERLGASIFLANNGSKPYVDPSKFHERNIGFVFQDYQHPEYCVQGYNFVPYLSVIDLIFWHGPEALDIILKERKENWMDEITYG